jgi:hypothetical protein
VQNGLAQNGRRQRSTKPGAIWPEQYILFRHLHNGSTLTALEDEFCWASSAIADSLQRMGNFYLGLLRRMTLVQWPSLPEIERLIQLAPPYLRDERAFCTVDTTKIFHNDSINPDTAALHYDSNKGYGLKVAVFISWLGDPICIEYGYNGNGADSTQYETTQPYLQSNGFAFPNDATIVGDGSYRGKAQITIGSRDLIHPLNAAERAAVPEHLREVMWEIEGVKKRNRAVVEQFNRRGKIGMFGNRHSSQYSLDISRNKAVMWHEIAFLHATLIMRIRGQRLFSNPEVYNPIDVNGVVDPLEKHYNEATGNLYTANGYFQQFFGPNSNGLNHQYPMPIPINGFP